MGWKELIIHPEYRYEDIRNFYFENEKGQQIDLQKISGKLFLYNVTGLGFERELEYARVGTTFVKNKDELKQGVIQGELEFYENTYDEYKNFVDFIFQAKALKLIYISKGKNKSKYYRDIDIAQIEKNDEDEYNILPTPITLLCKSLWYEENNFVYTVEEIEDELRWDFEWDSRFTDYENRSVLFENNGHEKAPFLLEMIGYVLNPTISVYVENELVNELTLNVTIEVDEKLVFSTRDNEYKVYKLLSNGTIENLFDDLDLNNKENFFKLPIGFSTIRLSAENEILNSKLTIYKEYIAV